METLSTSISVASRSYTECEMLSYLPNMLVETIQQKFDLGIKTFCVIPDYITEALQIDEQVDGGQPSI